MKRDETISIVAALLGVIAGALLAVLVMKATAGRKLSVEGPGWSKVIAVLNTVDADYVDEIDHKAVSEDVISETLSRLDPHSMYMPPVQRQASEEDLSGGFEGIGIQFNVPNDTAIVLEVIPGGPSEKVGIMPGDRLIKVDETVIAGVKYPQDSMVRRMKGPSGTKVTIKVLRDGEETPFEITRGRIPLHSVDASFMLNDTTGYIRLSKFSATTSDEFRSASAELLSQGMTHLITDLRDNSGGYLNQSLFLSNLFLEKGRTIVYTEGLHDPRHDYLADGRGSLKDIALTVLINENSASASEIVAGAVQDNDRGVIIGRRSFGKGLVQKLYEFSDGSGMRLTVSRYHTPSGRCIQKPYNGEEDYADDLYNRYLGGEMLDADSIKVDKSEEYHTVGGRTVYGGGGIVPDIFVPMDTTRASDFYLKCSRKATPMRFASFWFDSHKAELSKIDDFASLTRYLDASSIEKNFLDFARQRDGLVPASRSEWEESRSYMLTQVRALVGRYSKLGEKAYYYIYSEIDTTIQEALKPHSLD